MNEFAQTRNGQIFLSDVHRIADALEALSGITPTHTTPAPRVSRPVLTREQRIIIATEVSEWIKAKDDGDWLHDLGTPAQLAELADVIEEAMHQSNELNRLARRKSTIKENR